VDGIVVDGIVVDGIVVDGIVADVIVVNGIVVDVIVVDGIVVDGIGIGILFVDIITYVAYIQGSHPPPTTLNRQNSPKSAFSLCAVQHNILFCPSVKA